MSESYQYLTPGVCVLAVDEVTFFRTHQRVPSFVAKMRVLWYKGSDIRGLLNSARVFYQSLEWDGADKRVFNFCAAVLDESQMREVTRLNENPNLYANTPVTLRVKPNVLVFSQTEERVGRRGHSFLSTRFLPYDAVYDPRNFVDVEEGGLHDPLLTRGW